MQSTSLMIQAVLTIIFTIIDHGSDIALAFRYYGDTDSNDTILAYDYMYDVYANGEVFVDSTFLEDPDIVGKVVHLFCFS